MGAFTQPGAIWVLSPKYVIIPVQLDSYTRWIVRDRTIVREHHYVNGNTLGYIGIIP